MPGEFYALTAKYRDLWENSLPRDMLYQLAMYPMSQKGRRIGTILYPAADNAVGEARIEIRDPIRGSGYARSFSAGQTFFA